MLRLPSGRLLAVLVPLAIILARPVFVPMLVRGFAGDATLKDLRGFARFGVGPFLELVEDAFEAKEALPSN